MLNPDKAPEAVATEAAPAERPRPKATKSLLLLLVAVTGTGALATNILLPAIPSMAIAFKSDSVFVQYTISLFILGLGLSQLVLGPLSDRFGRRAVMIGGFSLFAVSSIVAIFVDTIQGLIIARMVQAFGAATGVVIGRAIIRDLVDRDRTASLIGLVTSAMVISPLIAPVMGGFLDTFLGWHSIFVFIASVGAVLLLWCVISLPETAPPESRSGGFAQFAESVRVLFSNRAYIGYALTGSLSCGPYYVFIGAVPFLVISVLGQTSAEYGMWMVLSAIGYMAGTFTCSRLVLRHGLDKVIPWGLVILNLATFACLIAVNLVPQHGMVITMAIFIANGFMTFGNGLVLPNTLAAAVSVRPKAAGAAAGIAGFTQMALGSVIAQGSSYLIVAFPSATTVAVLCIATTIASLLLFWLLVPHRPKDAPPLL